MANSNRKKARKLQEAKQTKKAESAKKAKFVKQSENPVSSHRLRSH